MQLLLKMLITSTTKQGDVITNTIRQDGVIETERIKNISGINTSSHRDRDADKKLNIHVVIFKEKGMKRKTIIEEINPSLRDKQTGNRDIIKSRERNRSRKREHNSSEVTQINRNRSRSPLYLQKQKNPLKRQVLRQITSSVSGKHSNSRNPIQFERKKDRKWEDQRRHSYSSRSKSISPFDERKYRRKEQCFMLGNHPYSNRSRSPFESRHDRRREHNKHSYGTKIRSRFERRKERSVQSNHSYSSGSRSPLPFDRRSDGSGSESSFSFDRRKKIKSDKRLKSEKREKSFKNLERRYHFNSGLNKVIKDMIKTESHHIKEITENNSGYVKNVLWCPKYINPDINEHVNGGTVLLHHFCRSCHRTCLHLMGRYGTRDRKCIECISYERGWEKKEVPRWYFHTSCEYCSGGSRYWKFIK